MAEDGFREAALLMLEELRQAVPNEIADELGPAALDALLEDALAEVTLTLHGEAEA